MPKYINTDHFLEYLDKVRANRNVNVNPYMDNALLNVRQMIAIDMHNPCLFDFVDIGNCDGCEWKNTRPQKCSCCRRNRHIKDCYKEN